MKNCFYIVLSDEDAPVPQVAIADITNLGDMLPGTRTITRINVPTPFRGRGHGSQLLQQICDAADEAQVILSLEIMPSGPLDYEALQDWYWRYGFYELQSIPGIYCRNPKEPE